MFILLVPDDVSDGPCIVKKTKRDDNHIIYSYLFQVLINTFTYLKMYTYVSTLVLGLVVPLIKVVTSSGETQESGNSRLEGVYFGDKITHSGF